MATQTKYTVVKIDFIAAETKMLQCTARKDMVIEGENGASVTLKAGEEFTLVRSDSLGEGWFYIVRQVSGEKKCSCPSHKPCKHEKAVQTVRIAICNTSPVVSHVAAIVKQAVEATICKPVELTTVPVVSKSAKPTDIGMRGNINTSRAFSLMR
jgi:hypothetical protein